MTTDPRTLLDTYDGETVDIATARGLVAISRIRVAPKAFAALRAILDLHRPYDASPATCVECSEREDTYNDMPWPCPTVQAIVSALETK